MATESKRWFESGSEVGCSPEAVKRDHDLFKKRVGHLLRVNKQEISLANSKDELDQQISDIRDTLPARDVATSELQATTKIQDSYQDQRQAGAKQVASVVQRGLNEFSQFIRAYSGLANAVSTAGGPFAEVGFQSLSILLIVFVNKTKNDTRIVDCLNQIRTSLPRLDAWQQMYPNTAMRELVADAHQQIILISRAAAEYLSRFWRRTYLALNPIASTQFEELAAELHKTLAEVNAEGMMGLHDSSIVIKQTVLSLENSRKQLLSRNEELVRQIDGLKRDAERRDKEQDQRMMSAFQALLKVDSHMAATNVSAVKEVLMDIFPNHHHFSPTVPYTGYLQLNESDLKGLPNYQKWIDHAQSSLLFLSGSTSTEGRRLRGCSHCWLSPAAIYITETLLRQGSKVAFFSCHPELNSTQPPGEVVLSSLVSQVLEWRPDILRNKDVEFRQILGGSLDKTRESVLVDLLAAVLGEVEDLRTIHLVIDRLDRCKTPIDSIVNELARLISVIGSPMIRVKVAIVAETSGGEGNWRSGFLPEHEYATDRLYVVKHWNQRRLTPSETSVIRRPSIWSGTSSITV